MDKTARTIEQEISPFSELPQDLKQKVLSNLNPRDMAKTAEVSRGLRDASHTEFHNLLNNDLLTRVADRYRRKLLAPHLQTDWQWHEFFGERIPLQQGPARFRGLYGFTPTRIEDMAGPGWPMRLVDKLGRPIDRESRHH